jgi:polyisoprenoid-binding protein YceI
MKRLALLPLLLLATAAFNADETREKDPERYVIDRSHTQLTFVVRHMLVTNVRGKFNTFEGEILLDQQDITKSSVQVTIETASVDTDHERRDADLRGEDFFAADRFPTIKFVSKRIEQDGEGVVLVGDLTMRDVTKEVEIPFDLVGPVETGQGQKRIGIEGALTVNRFDWGLKWDRKIESGGLVVAEDVKIELNIEAATPRQR